MALAFAHVLAPAADAVEGGSVTVDPPEDERHNYQTMAKYNPRKIYGAWADGYVLDLHSTGSDYLGEDEFGHPQFKTHRTEIGELLFRLKYRSDKGAVNELVDAAEAFIRSWGVKITAILPVPPTRAYRTIQPVARLANELSGRLKIPVANGAIRKLKQFAELKNVYDAEERRRLLEGAFEVNVSKVKDQRILLFDDLYRSGATMNAITEVLVASGASVVYAFAFTQTRRS
jgi:predicted amidophosphoribosyltransferase